MPSTTRPARTSTREQPRVLVLVPDPLLASWVETELHAEGVVLQTARSVADVVAALVEDPPPRAQALVVDIDVLDAVDVLRLHAIREGGWFGAVIALGEVPAALRRSLNIEHVIPRGVTPGVLREALADIGPTRPTTRMIAFARTRPR